MESPLSVIETRVLGCLIEKSVVTPEYYPMTLNAVTNACNQKSSRDPVVSYDEGTVLKAIVSLRDKGLLWERSEAGNRVPKYAHRFENLIKADPKEQAILCLLMLRGPQTPGELRSRAGRLATFASPAEVETVLQSLMERPAGPLVERLPRQVGRKEVRYAQLIGERPDTREDPPAEPARAPDDDRVAALEAAVRDLAGRVAALEAQTEGVRAPADKTTG